MRIIKEGYETLIQIVKNLRSTRNQLIWLATGLFCFAVIKGVDHGTLGTIAGLLTIVYTFYFSSKHTEAKHNHELKMSQNQYDRDKADRKEKDIERQNRGENYNEFRD